MTAANARWMASRSPAKWEGEAPAEPLGLLCRRRGLSLVEMLVAISLLSVAMAAIGILLHTVWRAEQASRGHRAATASIARLAEQFRADVHVASQAAGPSPDAPPSNRLSLALPDDRSVAYERGDEQVVRVERTGEDVKRREAYRLPPQAAAVWRLTTIGDRPAVTMAISGPTSSASAASDGSRVLRVDAIVGAEPQVMNLAER